MRFATIFRNYSDVYGDGVNRQLLLNLARESLQEPIYFIQLAQISSQYQFSTSAGFTPNWANNSPPNGSGLVGVVQRTLTLGGSVGAGITATPQFQSLPLAGSNFVQTIMTPISDKVFWTLYDQGWPADWVARTMLSSIEKRIYDESATNTNTNTYHTEYYVNEPSDPTYPFFLKYCNDLYNAQVYHILMVERTNSDAKSVVFQQTNQPQTDAIAKATPLRDIVSAVAGGLFVSESNNIITVEKHPDVTSITFFVKPAADEQLEKIFKYNGFSSNAPGCSNLASARAAVANALTLAGDLKTNRIHFTTRTFEAALNGVASEEEEFRLKEKDGNCIYETWGTNNFTITFQPDEYGTIAIVTNWSGPPFTVRPILMTHYDGFMDTNLSEMVSVGYEGKTYSIADLKDDRHDPSEKALAEYFGYDPEDVHYQNRMVFSMLSYLFTASAVDTTKLPVQQLIQLQ